MQIASFAIEKIGVRTPYAIQHRDAQCKSWNVVCWILKSKTTVDPALSEVAIHAISLMMGREDDSGKLLSVKHFNHIENLKGFSPHKKCRGKPHKRKTRKTVVITTATKNHIKNIKICAYQFCYFFLINIFTLSLTMTITLLSLLILLATTTTTMLLLRTKKVNKFPFHLNSINILGKSPKQFPSHIWHSPIWLNCCLWAIDYDLEMKVG